MNEKRKIGGVLLEGGLSFAKIIESTILVWNLMGNEKCTLEKLACSAGINKSIAVECATKNRTSPSNLLSSASKWDRLRAAITTSTSGFFMAADPRFRAKKLKPGSGKPNSKHALGKLEGELAMKKFPAKQKHARRRSLLNFCAVPRRAVNEFFRGAPTNFRWGSLALPLTGQKKNDTDNFSHLLRARAACHRPSTPAPSSSLPSNASGPSTSKSPS